MSVCRFKHYLAIACLVWTALFSYSVADNSEVSAVAAGASKPQRVVSMNLCTDQLALLLADPGQLISVSYLAHDARMAVFAEQARRLPVNHGRAEEIFMLESDLVLAGTFTSKATVHLLKHLGHRVETFAPAYSFAEIRTNLIKMGEVLGQAERATRLLKAFDQRRQTLAKIIPGHREYSASGYGANLYLQGANSLERDMVEHAGFVHYGEQQGFKHGGRLSLEALVLEPPDVLLISDFQQGTKAYEHLVHPALSRSVPPERRAGIQTKYWICGTPVILDAVEELITLRQQIEQTPIPE